MSWVPESCTLPTAEQPLRVAEFESLFATSAQGAVRTASTRLRVQLQGPQDLEFVVRDLTDRESACCSFFTFTVSPTGPGAVTLDIEVDADHIAVLDGIARRF